MFINKKYLFYFLFLLGSFYFLYKNFNFVNAEENPKIIISEVRIGSENSVYDEFIELYNYGEKEINLSNWSLKRFTKSGGDAGYVSSDLGTKKYPEIISDKEIILPPNSYFLLIPRNNCGENKDKKCFLDDTSFDNYYSTNSYLAVDNSLVLYDENKNIIDSFAWGNFGDINQEIQNPEKSQSIIREFFDENIKIYLSDVPNPNSSSVLVDKNIEENSDSVQNENSEENQSDNNINSNNNYGGSYSNSGTDSEDSNPVDFYSDSSKELKDNFVFINEFLINPEGSDSDNEFIEIYNSSEKDIDISNWILEDQVGRIKEYKIPENTILFGNSFIVFYSEESGITLNNTGDGIVLKNDFGEILDSTPITEKAEEEVSYSKIEDNWFWTNKITTAGENILEMENTEVEKTNEKNTSIDNNDKNVFDFSDQIIISEFLPNPTGRDNQDGSYEWIEVLNIGEKEVNLKGWILDDIKDKGSGEYQIKEDLIIKPNEYLVFSSKDSKIFLNNSGDEVNLYWPNYFLIDSVSYLKTEEGKSYSLFEGEKWGYGAPTPGSENIIFLDKTVELDSDLKEDFLSVSNSEFFIEEEDESDFGLVLDSSTFSGDEFIDEYRYVDVSEIKKIPLGCKIGFDAIVSTPLNVFEDNIFYVYDVNLAEGIQIYDYNKIKDNIYLGDKIQIFGYVSESGGERRVVLENNFILEKISENNLLTFPYLLIKNIDSSKIGNLVQVKGVVENINDNKKLFYLNDGSGKIKIYIKPNTNINLDINKNDVLMITGQVSSTSNGIRILPRFVSDISFLENDFDVTIRDEKYTDNKILGYTKPINVWIYLVLFINIFIILDWLKNKINKSNS